MSSIYDKYIICGYIGNNLIAFGVIDMCMGSSPSVPATPEVQAAPQEQDAAVVDARDEETRRRRAAAGRSSTLLTGSQGDTSTANTSGKTLLGQ